MRILYFIPGAFQIFYKRYFFGIILFILGFSSIALFLKVNLFDERTNKHLEYCAAIIFILSYFFNFLCIVLMKTKPDQKMMNKKELYEKGRLSLLKQNYELAIIHFESLLKIKPDDEDVIYQLGKAYIEFSKKERAIKLFRKNKNKITKKWKFEINSIIEELENNDS